MSEDWGTRTGSSWSENLPELSLRETDRMDKGMLKRNVGKFLRMAVGSAAVSVVMPSGLNHTSVWIKFYTFVWSLCYVNYISKKLGESLLKFTILCWTLTLYHSSWERKIEAGKRSTGMNPRSLRDAVGQHQGSESPGTWEFQPALRFQLPFLMLLRNQGQNIHREHC